MFLNLWILFEIFIKVIWFGLVEYSISGWWMLFLSRSRSLTLDFHLVTKSTKTRNIWHSAKIICYNITSRTLWQSITIAHHWIGGNEWITSHFYNRPSLTSSYVHRTYDTYLYGIHTRRMTLKIIEKKQKSKKYFCGST